MLAIHIFGGDEFGADAFGDDRLSIHPVGEEPGPANDPAQPFTGILHGASAGKTGQEEAHDALEESAAKAGHGDLL